MLNRFINIENRFDRYVIHLFFFRITLKKNKTKTLQSDVGRIKSLLMDTRAMNGLMDIMLHQELIMELMLDRLYLMNHCKSNYIDCILDRAKSVSVSYWGNDKPAYIFDGLPSLFNVDNYRVFTDAHRTCADCYCMWGTQPFNANIALTREVLYHNKPLLFFEGGFISTIESWGWVSSLTKYNQTISFVIDDLSPYYDARRANRLENMLEDRSIVLSPEQFERSRSLIKIILDNHISKYNHQPIFTPSIGRPNVKKVLVVDQCYNDMSIIKGGACEQTFSEMLQTAIDENPDADIIIKTHPDTISGAKGYFSKVKKADNIHPFTEAINPICLLSYVEKVYVCTSQLGFEALMLGKEVHVFGIPFYAGWGLTNDKQTSPRRTNKRSVEELFYIAYILYSYYVSPQTKKICQIEDAIQYIINTREEYFRTNSKLK